MFDEEVSVPEGGVNFAILRPEDDALVSRRCCKKAARKLFRCGKSAEFCLSAWLNVAWRSLTTLVAMKHCIKHLMS